jgi:hypothetical protein
MRCGRKDSLARADRRGSSLPVESGCVSMVQANCHAAVSTTQVVDRGNFAVVELLTPLDAAHRPRVQFGEIRKLRPKLGKAVLHVSLSAAPGEHLTDAQWTEIGQRYLHGMGLDDNQYLITRHDDTEHEHVHLLVNRIRFDGDVTSDSHDYRRHEVLMRAIERDYQLQPVRPSIEAKRHAATKGEIEQGLRTGVPSTRQRLQQLCDGAITTSRSYSDYAERLEAAGVELLPVTQLDAQKLSGLSYRLEGVMMKGSDLGRGYSPVGLAKRGISYEKNRDLAAVSRQREREEHRRPGDADRSIAPGEDRERQPIGVHAGADHAGDGGVDGRNALHADGDWAKEPRAQLAVRAGGNDRGEGGATRSGDGGAGGRPNEPGGPQHAVDALPAIGADWFADSGPRERILALAGTDARDEPIGRSTGGRAAAARDRSLEAVKAQIGAMGAERYEVVIINAKTKKQTTREWRTPDLVKSVNWLKRMNAQGSDIYIRPLGGPELMLVDGLDTQQLERIRGKGLAPAAVIETAPGQFEAWVKLSDFPLPESLRQTVLLGLARNFPRAGQLGRLAGFTNQQSEANRAGQQSYVLAREATGRVAPFARPYLEAIERLVREHAIERQRLAQVERERLIQIERQQLVQIEKAMRAPSRDRGRSR